VAAAWQTKAGRDTAKGLLTLHRGHNKSQLLPYKTTQFVPQRNNEMKSFSMRVAGCITGLSIPAFGFELQRVDRQQAVTGLSLKEADDVHGDVDRAPSCP
jgi:hypothetical protein